MTFFPLVFGRMCLLGSAFGELVECRFGKDLLSLGETVHPSAFGHRPARMESSADDTSFWDKLAFWRCHFVLLCLSVVVLI